MTHLRFTSTHTDYLHDIVYNWGGTLLATASSDHTISVWRRSTSGVEWTPLCVLRAHNGPIHSLSFAHPSFGNLLASGSSDRAVSIFAGDESFRLIVRLVDSNDSVTSVAFSPPHLGLKLAAACLSGHVRVYESRDVINLSDWSLTDSLSIECDKLTCANVSWCGNLFIQPLLAVSADSSLSVYAYSTKPNARNVWQAIASCVGHSNYIHSIEFAPSVGRSYELVASGCADQRVRLFKLSQGVIETQKKNQSSKTEIGWQASCIASFALESIVLKVSFNVSGSMLASTADDGLTRIYTCTDDQQWKQIKTLAENESEEVVGNETDWIGDEFG